MSANVMSKSEEKQAQRDKLRAVTAGGGLHIEHPFPIQSMPNYPRWHIAAFFLSPLIALGLNYIFHTSWFWAVPCCVVVILVCQQRFLIRCPQCSRRLHIRTVRQKLGACEQEDHMFYDCPVCKVTWDPHIITPVPSHNQP